MRPLFLVAETPRPYDPRHLDHNRSSLVVSTPTPNARRHRLPQVYFRDYNPEYFAEVRALCGIDDEAYAATFAEPPTAEKFSEGRSGAFLYFSHSSEYMIKVRDFFNGLQINLARRGA